MKRRYLFPLVLASVLYPTSLLAQQHHHHGAEGGDANAAIEKFGQVHMPISCAASVQAPFERGIALMHSFWYEEAVKQFQAIATSDPQCAMAQWGLAMAEWRPFWDGLPDDRRKAGVAEIDKATALNAKTDRERRYIAALSGYLHADHGDPAQNDKALHAYDDAMSALHTAYPDDVEATAFYGLALSASIDPTKDPVADARKALAVLEPGFRAHPDHPGFAHYIIHTCDSPQLAREALPAAEKYASIAPSSAHALHMPGHIFARLGMWQKDIDSDEASVHASESAEQHHLGGITHQIHAYEFLIYAYLQVGQDEKARVLMTRMRALGEHMMAMPGMDDMKDAGHSLDNELRAVYAMEMHQWDVLAHLRPAPGSKPYEGSAIYWGKAVAAGHTSDAKLAAAALKGYEDNYQALKNSPYADFLGSGNIRRNEILAWKALTEGRGAEAVEDMRKAADEQDKVGQNEVDVPGREMLGDVLMVEHRPKEALVQYRVALQLSPNRLNT